MLATTFKHLTAEIAAIDPRSDIGRVVGTDRGCFVVDGLSNSCALGDRVEISSASGQAVNGEIVRLEGRHVSVLTGGHAFGVAQGDKVVLLKGQGLSPDVSWVGRLIDPDGKPLDGRPILRGPKTYPHLGDPPPATDRCALGERLETGMKIFNTVLPLARGQRLGLFAGSGVGKSTLIGRFARNLKADIVVIALVGERGREVREFVDTVLGQEGMLRSVVVAATSDRSPFEKRRAAWAAMSVAEYFRDLGRHVLLVVDSLTRFAEAHREVALASGESASMRGFPPSTGPMIMSLCERAGPGTAEAGDITAVFSVLVAGSDMDEPIADVVRGVLDGHVVLDRKIAERGRFPAVDVLRSVSRSLPEVATSAENELIRQVRSNLGAYESAELMVKAGLYSEGSDPEIDRAVGLWPKLDDFFAQTGSTEEGFVYLKTLFGSEE